MLLLFALTILLVSHPVIASAQAIGDELSLDGFAFDQDPLTNPPYDWDEVNGINPPPPPTIYSSGVIADGTPTQFTGGHTKDIYDVSEWFWESTENIPDKDNLTNAYVTLFAGGKLYFGADRYANNGDAMIGFWLFRNPVLLDPATNTFVDDQGNPATHADGDILILLDFTNGGQLATPAVYLWQSGVGLVGPQTGLDAEAISNAGTVSSPWDYTAKFPVNCQGATWCFPDNSFFEGGFGLPPGYSRCFSSFLVETRSSQETTAVLKDFILGAFNTKPTVEIADVTICEGQTGSLCANVTGGQAPYHYAWSGPGGPYPDAACIDVTLDGTYTVIVTDSESCTGEGSGTVTVNPRPVVTLTDQSDCPGTPPNDPYEVTFTAQVVGGTAPFQYSWDGGAFGDQATLTTSVPGEHCVVVKDALQCEGNDCANALVYDAPTVTVADQSDCPGTPPNDPYEVTFTAVPGGGTPPYQYSWDGGNFGNAATFTTNVAGPHNVVVRDAHECKGADEFAALVYEAPTVTVADQSDCPDTPENPYEVTFTAVPGGGTPPYQYSWDGGNFGNSATFTTSVVGEHCVVVKDAHDCLGTDCAMAIVLPGLTVTVDDQSDCPGTPPNDGYEVTFTAVPGGGTPPYQYSWDGGNFGNSATFTTNVPGEHCVVVRDSFGCQGTDCGQALVYDSPTVSVADQYDCPGTPPNDGYEVTFTAVPDGGTPPYQYSWDGGNFGNSASFTTNVQGEHCVVIRDAHGCKGTDCANALVYGVPTVTLEDQYDCPNDPDDPQDPYDPSHEYQVTFTAVPAGGTPPYQYSWDGGNFVDSATFVTDVEGEHCVIVRDAHSCKGTDCANALVRPAPSCELSAPDPLPLCNATGTLSVPDSYASYEWMITDAPAGWEITGGEGTNSITYSTGDTGPATFRLIVTNEFDCPGYCSISFTCQPQGDEFCSFTQGAYGNAGGYFNGMSTIEILNSLITPADPLTIGILGVRSLTIADGSEQCIINRLPAGGTVDALPIGFGDKSIVPPNCQTDPPLPVNNQGNFRNVLIGQTITLDLNIHWDTHLGTLQICRYMTTIGVTAGPNGIYGDDDDEPIPGDIANVVIPQEVIDALPEPPTVNDLLALANRALSGESGLPSKSLINLAVDGINRGFDECRILVRCADTPPMDSDAAGKTGPSAGDVSIPLQFNLSANYPNPVRTGTSINLDLPERSHVRFSVFDVSGREVMVVIDQDIDAGYQTLAWGVNRSQQLPAGVYFYRAMAHGLDSGRVYTQARKLLIVP